jgi:hypothetical protein
MDAPAHLLGRAIRQQAQLLPLLDRRHRGCSKIPFLHPHLLQNQHHTQKIKPITTHTQTLHQLPQRQQPPHRHTRITPTTTTHITPIRTLHTPKHHIHTIPLPQRPTLLPQTTQRSQTRLRPHTLAQTRLHLHHRLPTHLLHALQQPTTIPLSSVPHQQRTQTHHPIAITRQPLQQQPPFVRIDPTHQHPPPPNTAHPDKIPTPPPSHGSVSAVSQHHADTGHQTAW